MIISSQFERWASGVMDRRRLLVSWPMDQRRGEMADTKGRG